MIKIDSDFREAHIHLYMAMVIMARENGLNLPQRLNLLPKYVEYADTQFSEMKAVDVAKFVKGVTLNEQDEHLNDLMNVIFDQLV